MGVGEQCGKVTLRTAPATLPSMAERSKRDVNALAG
jgi:hypothetical protein